MTGTLVVGRARLPCGAQTAAAALLETLAAELADPEPHAVLVARHLRVSSVEGAVQDVDELRRRAVRPARGDVDPAAPAVLFTDEAELLACLARDAAAGAVGQRWYWRHLATAPRHSDSEAVTAAFVNSARWVPQAFEQLSPIELAGCVTALGATGATAVAQAVAGAFGMPLAAPSRVDGAPPARRVRAPVRTPIASALGNDTDSATTIEERHIATVLDELTAQIAQYAMPVAGRVLVTLARMLTRAPALARLPDVSRTIEAVAAQHDAAVSVSMCTESDADARENGAVPSIQTGRTGVPPDGMPDVDVDVAYPREPSRALSKKPGAPADDPLWWLASGAPVLSEIAGAFYLINVLELLDLPRVEVTGSASGWTVVEVLARALLGEAVVPREDIETDPAWAILADLDGRERGVPADPGVWGTPVADAARRLLARYEVGPDVAHRRGLIAVTRTHVDVMFDIESIDMSLRRCGLDRDPGWVPALARIVTFHFVDRLIP